MGSENTQVHVHRNKISVYEKLKYNSQIILSSSAKNKYVYKIPVNFYKRLTSANSYTLTSIKFKIYEL